MSRRSYLLAGRPEPRYCPPNSLCHIPKPITASCRPTMKLTSIACGLVALFAGHASATALTYKLVANEKACFYANNQDKGQKIAFYFAVRTVPERQLTSVVLC